MGAFLSIARGSVEVPWLLEIRLNMSEEKDKDDEIKPLVLVGKGNGILLFWTVIIAILIFSYKMLCWEERDLMHNPESLY